MGISRFVGAGLLVISTISLVQTVRELLPLLTRRWTETTMTHHRFTFAGRAIEISRPTDAEIGATPEAVLQERVRIDGVSVGEATGRRMATWRMRNDERSSEWLKAVIIEDRKDNDSSLWIARRLQPAETDEPRIETITVDAAGAVNVRMHSADNVDGAYQLSVATATITDQPRLDFPLSAAAWGVWVPFLWLVYPIGTGVLGFVLLREPRVPHPLK